MTMKRKVMMLVGIIAIMIAMVFWCGSAMAATGGNWRGMDWSLDDDGVLTLGNGETQTVTPIPDTMDCNAWPWHYIRDSIKEVKCNGTIVFSGSLKGMFCKCNNLVKADLSGFNTENVTTVSGNTVGQCMFYQCSNLVELDISEWNTCNIVDMRSLFAFCNSLSDLNISAWDVSNVTNMRGMFNNCSSLVDLDLSDWNTSHVTNMASMFSGCSKLASLDVSGWDTSSVMDMSSMFNGCSVLEDIDIANFDASLVTKMDYMFAGCAKIPSIDGSRWNVRSVMTMSQMCSGCEELIDIDLSGWDVSHVTQMYRMFQDCKNLETINLAGWNPSSAVDIYYMFSHCESVKTLDLSNWNLASATNAAYMFQYCSALENLNISGWQTPNLTDMRYMFYMDKNLKDFALAGLDVSNVTTMERMCWSCESLENLDLSGWDTSSLTNIDYLFRDCSGMKSLDLSGWDTSGITKLNELFAYCSSLEDVNLSGWDTSNVINMSYMFSGCESLTLLDLSHFDTSQVTTMSDMFARCKALEEINLTEWHTGNVIDMSDMFLHCHSLKAIDVSDFDTHSVTNMYCMFGASGLEYVDLSTFNTSNVTKLSFMFQDCTSLEGINVSGWDTTNVTTLESMFRGCSNLKEVDLSSFDTSNVQYYWYLFSGCRNLKVIDISGFNVSAGRQFTYMYNECISLENVMLGETNPFIGVDVSVVLPTPPLSKDGIAYTRKWIREDGTYGPYTPAELRDNYTSAMAGKWVWEKVPTEYTISFVCIEDGYMGAMPPVTAVAAEDYELPGNAFRVFGYEFDYWTDGTRRIWVDRDVIPANTYAVNSEVTLTAVFEPRDRSISMQDGAFDFSIKADEKALFSPIPASTAYQVYEQTSFGWNLIAQTDASGIIMPDAESEALFLNQYDPLKVTVRFVGTKLMDGSAAEVDSFNFLLYEDDTLVDIASVSNGGLIEFQPITYDSAGTHHYYIKEAVGNDNTISYDIHVEEITVEITSDGAGNLFADVAMDEDEILFENASKPGYLVLSKANAVADSRTGIFMYEVQFTSENGQPYELFSGDITYEERDEEISELPIGQPQPEKPKYTLTVTQNHHVQSGYVQSDMVTEEFSQGEMFSLDWVGKPAADVTITEGEDYLIRSGSGWKGIMPAQNLNVTINYSNTYVVLDKRAVRSFATLSRNFESAVNLMHKNGTARYSRYNSTDSDNGMNVDDGTTECVVQLQRGHRYDVYRYAFNWYTNADVIYLPEDCSYLFTNLGVHDTVENAEKFDFLSYVDSSRVTNMKKMFNEYGWKTLDVSNLNTNNVTDMSYMFNKATDLTSLDLSNFNTANVTDMSYMFHGDIYLEELDLSSFDTSSVINMSHMFYNCSRLPLLDLSGFDTSHVTDMTDMYLVGGPSTVTYGALRAVILGEHNPFVGDGTSAVLPSPAHGSAYTNGEYIEYSGKWIREDGAYGPYTSEELRDNYTGAMAGKWVWQVAPPNATISGSLWRSNVNGYTSGPLRSMTHFVRNTTYESIDDLPTGAVKIDDGTTDCSIYFWTEGTTAYWWSDAETVHLPDNCGSLFSDCSSLVELDLSEFDVFNVTSMSSMFRQCSNLVELNLSGWETQNVTSMYYMFYRCNQLVDVNMSSFDTSNVTDMSSMFYACTHLESLDLSSFKTSKVTDMSNMFSMCTRMATLTLSTSFDTSAVRTMSNMFYECTALTGVDTSNWNTSNVTNMEYMFRYCANLADLDVSNWNTEKVTTVNDMLRGCVNLTSVDMSKWNTSAMTNLYGLFCECTGLTTIDLSSFDNSNVTSMGYMFNSCSNLTTIYVSELWDTSNLPTSYQMFTNCTSLVGGSGTPYDAYSTGETYARVDNLPDEPGYFTYKAAPTQP